MSEILINFMGRFANQLIQYMTARSIQIESGMDCPIKFSRLIEGVNIGHQIIDTKILKVMNW